MSMSRRFLPPMSLLCAFEAAARHKSFTTAAAELHLTQGAVSKQIRALEDRLETALFVRDRQTVRLSPAGQAYAAQIRSALTDISRATLDLRTNPQGGNLNLAILPTFGTRWLAPRLPTFLSLHPGITVHLTTRLSPFDFQFDALDAAIHFGQPNWPGADMAFLMRETVVPACHPSFLLKHPLTEPGDLLEVPLLHLSSRPAAWHSWFQSKGVRSDQPPGMSLDQFATAAQAAISGVGIALLPRFLIERELSLGELVVPIPEAEMTSAESYYLVWPKSRAEHPPLLAFKAWISQACSEFTASQPAP